MLSLFQRILWKSPLTLLLLSSCFVGVVSEDEGLNGGCVKLASSVPEDLVNWVLGTTAVLAVVFTGLGQAQPLKRLQMPHFRHMRVSLLAASIALLLWAGSAIAVIMEWVDSAPRHSSKCDVLRVIWTVTPHVIGTAALGVLLLLRAARRTASIPAPPIQRSESKSTAPFSIQPADSYGNGAVALKNLRSTVMLNTTWLIGVAVSILFAFRADVLAGLLNTAGILAVWSNTLLPEWNPSEKSGGQDTLTTNTVEPDYIEINVIGENYDQSCIIIQPKGKLKKRLRTDPSGLSRCVTARMYALANAHAAATDFKDAAFKLETYQSSVTDAERLADIVIEQTELVVSRLGVILKDVKYKDASHRLAFTALVASVLDSDPWSGGKNQRTRLRALGIAEAWLNKLISASGRKVNSALNSSRTNHDASQCKCPIHRWGTRHKLKPPAEEEAKHLLRPGVKLPAAVSPEQGMFAQELWKGIVERASYEHRNPSMLISIYLNALHARRAIDLKDYDYYPIFDLELIPFSMEDFEEGCSFPTNAPNAPNPPGKPLVAHSAATRQADGFNSRYNDRLSVWYHNQRAVVVPFHPKVIMHVAIRVLWRAIYTQSVVWLMISLRLLNQ